MQYFNWMFVPFGQHIIGEWSPYFTAISSNWFYNFQVFSCCQILIGISIIMFLSMKQNALSLGSITAMRKLSVLLIFSPRYMQCPNIICICDIQVFVISRPLLEYNYIQGFKVDCQSPGLAADDLGAAVTPPQQETAAPGHLDTVDT